MDIDLIQGYRNIRQYYSPLEAALALKIADDVEDMDKKTIALGDVVKSDLPDLIKFKEEKDAFIIGMLVGIQAERDRQDAINAEIQAALDEEITG